MAREGQFLFLLTITLTTKSVEGTSAELIAGCTVGAVVIVAFVVAVIIFLVIRRKQRNGTTNFMAKPSVYENVSPNGTLTSTSDTDNIQYRTVPDLLTAAQTKRERPKEKPKIREKPDFLKKKANFQVKPKIKEKPEHFKPKRRVVSDSSGSVYENTEIVPEVPKEHVHNTCIQVAELRRYVEKIEQTPKGFEKEYQRLPSGFKRTFEESQKEEHKGKNKFMGYYPYDYNRVVLSQLAGDPTSTYINASIVSGYRRNKKYIAAQAPKTKTLADFWRMIWEQRCGKIVMLTNLVEATKVKSEKYWDSDSPLTVGDLVVTVTKETVRSHWTIRDLTVKHKETSLTKTVIQFHFTAWPDHGVPDVTSLTEFIWRVRKTRSPRSGPLLVHCSAGIGRTGTYITIDYLLDEGIAENKIDVFRYVSNLRDQRKDMIQNEDQYACVHHSLVEAFTFGNTTLSCQDTDLAALGTFKMGLCVLSQFIKTIKQIPHAKTDGRSNTLYISQSPNCTALLVPSYTSRHGFIVMKPPPESLMELFWNMVQEQSPDVILCLPEANKQMSKICPGKGKSKTFAGMTVCCKGENKMNITNCKQIQIDDMEGNGYDTDVLMHSSGRLSVPCLAQLVTEVNTSRVMDTTRPIVVLAGEREKTLCAMFCVLSKIASSVSLDDEVEVYNNIRTVTRVLDHQLTKSDVEELVDLVTQLLPTQETYANVSWA